MKQLLVEANLKNINLVEEFIATATDIPQDKRSTALIIATEVFDNIAEHAILSKIPVSASLHQSFFFHGFVFHIQVGILIIYYGHLKKHNRILILRRSGIADSGY